MIAIFLTRKLLMAVGVLLLSMMLCARGGAGPRPEQTPRSSPAQAGPTVTQTRGENGSPATPSPVSPQNGGAQVPTPPSSPSDGPMRLQTVVDAESRGAVCNDGSPATYYFRPAAGEGSPFWSIHLQGGGFCYTEEDCTQRNRQDPNLMSSTQQPNNRPGNGIHSTSANQNPDFAGFNRVFINYCSSDLWSGTRSASGETGGLHFQGAAIFQAVIADLMDPAVTPGSSLAEARQILFSGSSSGGVGVMVHLDWLVETLPQARVRGVNDAGWFMAVDPFDSARMSFGEITRTAYEYWGGEVDESCAEGNRGQENLCYLGEVVYPHLATPLFVQISQLDRPQLGALGITPNLNAAEQRYVVDFSNAVRRSLQEVDAAYSPNQPGHGLLTSNQFWTLKIDGISLREVLGNWFFNRGESIKVIED